MPYKIEISIVAKRTLDKLDKESKKQILNYLNHVLAKLPSPRLIGKALVGDKRGIWRYRTGHFRILCQIEDEKLLVLVLKIGPRKDVYD